MTDQQRSLILVAWHSGTSWRSMCDRFKRVPRDALRAVLEESGARVDEIGAAQITKMTPEVVARVLEMVAIGPNGKPKSTIKAAAARIGVSEKTLAAFLRKRKAGVKRERDYVPAAYTVRTCMTCRAPFASEHRFNRICANCKGTELFRSSDALGGATGNGMKSRNRSEVV
jgi:hypothetical protein